MTKGRRLLRYFLIFLLIAVIIIAARFIWLYRAMGMAADSQNDTKVTVTIPDGSSSREIGNILDKKGLLSSVSAFNMKTAFDGAEYKAGTYQMAPSMTMDEIEEMLEKGADTSNTVKVTIPEGYNIQQIASKVADAGICTSDEFLKEAADGQFDYDFISQTISGEKRLEGYLYPDTYEFYKNASAHDVIDKMLSRFNEIYSEAAKTADSSITSKYSEQQIVTVASLVEREAKLDSERPEVASVVYNRLDKGMKLQFCSTVQYALGKVKARLYNSDLKVDSPYNTYINEGLPPGPIASPGRASIEAALKPAKTDYLYFVVSSKGDGSHNFAATGDDFAAYRDDYLSSLTGE